MSIGERIRVARAKKDITQSELARRLRVLGMGANQATVQRWERGKSKPHTIAVRLVSEVLEVDLLDYATVTVILSKRQAKVLDAHRSGESRSEFVERALWSLINE